MQNVTEPRGIKPELVPLPNRFWEVQREELGGRTKLHASPTEVADGVAIHLDPNSENVSEHLKVRSRPEEALTKHDEIGNMKNPTRRNMMQLAAEEVQ